MTKEHIILDQKSIGVSQYFFGLSERKNGIRYEDELENSNQNMETSRPDGIAGLAENKVEEKKCS